MKKIPDNLIKEYESLKRKREIDIENLQRTIDIADFYLDNEMYEYAIDEYLNASLEKEKDSIYFKLGYCYTKLKKYSAAFECYAKCKTNEETLGYIHECFVNPYNKKSENGIANRYNEIIKDYISKGKHVEIVESLNIIEKYKLNDYTYYQIGKTLYDNELYEISIRCFTKSIELLDLDITRFLRAKAYAKLNNTDDALNDLNKLIKENKDDLDYIYLKANILLTRLEYQNAMNEFKKIIKIDETFKEITYLTAICLNELKQYENAINFIKKSIHQNKSTEKLELKSKIYYNKKKFDKTIE